jgi:predicted transcriptional regulator
MRVSKGAAAAALAEPLKPAVPIKRSITTEYLVFLEDGKKFKSLKRHLRTRYQTTPDQYRAKWNLPPDYPMVAPNYAMVRSQLAKQIGLGERGRRSRRVNSA